MTLSVDDLAAATWRFSVNGQTATARLRLLPGGRIAGHRHPNEFYWRLDAARLILMNAARGVTSELELVSAPGEPLRFSGPYSGDPAIRFELTSHDPGPWPEFEPTRVLLAQQVADYGWSIGAHTYGAPGVAEGGLAKFTIGRFCSVAVGVVIALGDHKIANVTSYPFRGLKPLWPSTPHDAVDHTTRGDVTIGNDVWIGVNAFIGSGVTIGDGAVIGAGSVVTRDVPPYAIALGAPARVVRLRFTQPVIESLLAIAWWDWPEDWIDAVAPLLVSENIDGFIRIAKAGPGNLEALVLLVDEVLAVPPTPMAAIRAKGRGLLDRLRGRPN